MKSLVLLLLAAALPVLGQSDLFVGTWKLDVGKSHFHPGPGPTAETLTIAPDRVSVHDEIRDENGERTSDWSYTVLPDGQPAQITGRGMQNCTVTSKRINDHTIEQTWNFNGQILHGRTVLSNDGKTIRYTMTGTGRDGQDVHDVAIFKKEK